MASLISAVVIVLHIGLERLGSSSAFELGNDRESEICRRAGASAGYYLTVDNTFFAREVCAVAVFFKSGEACGALPGKQLLFSEYRRRRADGGDVFSAYKSLVYERVNSV